MDEYKPNSHVYKAAQQVENPPARVEKAVVTGVTKTKKKSDLSKVSEAFFSEDISTIKGYLLMDVLIPSIKNAIASIIKNGVDMLFWGKVTGGSDRPLATKISYGSFFSGSSPTQAQQQYQRASRPAVDYDEIIFTNRQDAEAVLSSMDDIIAKYGIVSIGDLYDLAQVHTTNYMVNKYGWTDIRSASVVHVRDGWMIKFPRAIPLN